MAEWGASETIPRDLFETAFLPKVKEPEAETSPNRLQCFALAFWAVGDIARAEMLYQRALEEITEAPRLEFSAWTYLYRSPKDFRADLQAMKSMMDTGSGQPEFIRRNRLKN